MHKKSLANYPGLFSNYWTPLIIPQDGPPYREVAQQIQKTIHSPPLPSKRVRWEDEQWKPKMLRVRMEQKAAEKEKKRQQKLHDHQSEIFLAKYRLQDLEKRLLVSERMTMRNKTARKNETARGVKPSSQDLGDLGEANSIHSDGISDCTSPTRVQDVVALWMAQGRDFTVPMEFWEPVTPSHVNVAYNTVATRTVPKERKPTGLSTFFNRVVRGLVPTAILDSGQRDTFSARGTAIQRESRRAKWLVCQMGRPNKHHRRYFFRCNNYARKPDKETNYQASKIIS